MIKNAVAGDLVELMDKETGFTDPVTGFDISRDQKLELTEPVGERTQQAVVSGCLLVVSGKAKKSERNLGEGECGSGAVDASGFAADYPGRQALVEAGLKSADVDKLDQEGLVAITGIGTKTAEAIIALRPKE